MRLTQNNIGLAANLILGDGACHLPIVYASCRFDGTYPLDLEGIASDLAGMAHVIVEPDRHFSRRLKAKVASQNVYGGTVGIYWPNATGRHAFFDGRQFESSAELKWAIIDEVRAALLNRRSLYRCTWEAVEEASRRATFDELRETGSAELSEYIAKFDEELIAKDARHQEAETEILRLRREVLRQQATAASTAGINLRAGPEQDLFTGELAEVVMDAIVEGVRHAAPDSRRAHILSGIVAANPPSTHRKEKREELKALLRGYRQMDGPTRAGLESLGFSISEDGKHYKLVYEEDDRYTFVLSKSGSDHRGGLNSASDIAKRIF